MGVIDLYFPKENFATSFLQVPCSANRYMPTVCTVKEKFIFVILDRTELSSFLNRVKVKCGV